MYTYIIYLLVPVSTTCMISESVFIQIISRQTFSLKGLSVYAEEYQEINLLKMFVSLNIYTALSSVSGRS